MPRTVTITVPAWQTDQLISELQQIKGFVGLRVQQGISLQPPGDVITVETTNRKLHSLLKFLSERGIGHDSSSAITTSEPTSIISKSSVGAIALDRSEATWEEMETVIAKESNMTINGILIMVISGILATIGIATNALHLVIAAMIIAPGFEPIIRISFGGIAQSRAWRRGVSQTIQAYAALVAAAALTALLLRLVGTNPLGRQPSYLPAGVLISYWTSISFSSILVTIVAAVAGALLIAVRRSLLLSGVMVALALIPSAAIFGDAIVLGEFTLAGQGLFRWLLEVAIILVISALVFAWKRSQVHQRKALL